MGNLFGFLKWRRADKEIDEIRKAQGFRRQTIFENGTQTIDSINSTSEKQG